MTTELTHKLENIISGHSINEDDADWLRALTQRPAAQTERDTGPRVLREVFALCEDTMDKMAAESTEFSRGRAFEAKGISRAIGTWFQDEYCGRSYMGEPSLPAPQQATPEPVTRSRQCTDPMCACMGGPCAECPEGEREKEIADLRTSLDFYKRRADALQQAQSRMRDPERTMVCDILANGVLLVPAGDRYAATPPQQAAGEPVGEVVYQLQSGDGKWIDQTRASYDYNVKHGNTVRVLYTRPAPGVPEGFTIDQIADACVQAEISDSKFESLGIALTAAQAKGGEHV